MNNAQCRDVAAQFVAALENSVATRDQWVAIFSQRDWTGLRTLIAETVGLEAIPTPADLEIMRTHAAAALVPQCDALQECDQRIHPQMLFNGMDQQARPGK
jgi:hypothetical protein